MSATDQIAGSSTDTFTAIFNAASIEYQTVTGRRLDVHPLAAQLDTCHTPDAISHVFRTQVRAFRKFRKGDEKLMAWLDPIVHILFTFSATLGEGIGLPFSPAKTIFSGVGVLLCVVRDVAESHSKTLRNFERIHLFLQRLNIYIGTPLTKELTELLGKIMAQLLCILALSTRAMTERRMKKFLKKLAGRSDVEDALQQLDTLTKEETSMTVARTLEVTHHVDDNVEEMKMLTKSAGDDIKAIQGVASSIDYNVKATKDVADEVKRNQLQEKLRTWLSPPDPSINHNNACKTQHGGTATWFTQGTTFREWKEHGNLLWIRGYPGTGKSVMCSAIIQDIKSMRQARPALIAYHYFDYKDTSKRNVHGLLTSLLFQLSDDSDRCRDVLHQLYKTCREGAEQASDTGLTECLNAMLELPDQLPTFVVIDALDECPNCIGTPSAREEVLDFVDDLVGTRHSNLFVCITSRPEQDIQAVFNPLTSPSCCMSLHEEQGQREDINNYVRFFVNSDRAMRRWRQEDKELVITTLSERTQGMFRWVSCQLDTLRRCMPSSIRRVLDELPTTLDDTYERALQGIPKEKSQHAHHLFQCLVAATRPLHAEELAEIFAIKFDADSGPYLMEGWRPENPEEAVLSTCSTLIAVIEDEGSQIVQFSHFSVKEYLTSDRLRASDVGNVRFYHIPLRDAHTTLARACLTVLLQLDANVDKKRLATFPLAFYAAQHWVDHAKFKEVALRIQDPMERLFDPRNPYLASWVWIHDVDWNYKRRWIDISEDSQHSPRPNTTALYYAALLGFSRLANYLIYTHAEDVKAKCGRHGTPLHAASYGGDLDTVNLLLDHEADVNAKDELEKTPLCSAYYGGHVEVMRLLLEHGARVDARYFARGTFLNDAASQGRVDVVLLLLQHKVNVNDPNADSMWTALHYASADGHAKVVKLLLEHGAEVNVINKAHNTPLWLASAEGYLEVGQMLLEHGADVHIRGNGNRTPLQIARSNMHIGLAQLLWERGAQE